MKDKKALLVSHEMSYTGAPRSLLQMAGILKENGYCVSVWMSMRCDSGGLGKVSMLYERCVHCVRYMYL